MEFIRDVAHQGHCPATFAPGRRSQNRFEKVVPFSALAISASLPPSAGWYT